ncbi:phospholipase D-like domain-containing protein [Pleurocapsa sp. PCC 7319]|uniref:phospholipase D-like domain-containing protein n=1 Tax=Pleurocapsa sp. PCC 7319 TaxID=118161 RepID=UPI0003725C33|nr:phospholipase D-like domain-containing protein [Pleurocapsa sp. PCC 7319]
MSRYFRWMLVLSLTLLNACKKESHELSAHFQDQFIQVYFNHRASNFSTYIDPYREIERSGDNLEAVIIEQIATANDTIDLAVQELNLPLIAQALVKSHRSGVKVRVVLDNNYSQSLSELTPQEVKRLNRRDRQKYNEYFQLVDLNRNGTLSTTEIAQQDALVILRQADIPLIDDTADGSKGSGLMHHKYLVIDGQKVIAGSANFTLSGIHGDFSNRETKGNINHLLTIDNVDVAGLFTEEFDYMWGDNSDGGINSKFGLAKPWRSPISITWKNTEITIQFSPTSSNKKDWQLSSNGSIGKVLNQANDSIDLALFVFSEQEIADILQQKQQEGVKIRGVFDPSFAFRYYSEVLDMLGVTLYYHCQAEANNNPWQKPLETIGTPLVNVGDKLHHKFSLIDSQIVISGSQNWSKAANYNNDEALIIINNPTVAKHFDQEFQRLYQQASLGLPQRINNQLKQQQKCN